MAHPFSNRPAFVGIHDGLFGFGTGQALSASADAALCAYANVIPQDVTGDTVWNDYAAMQHAIFHELRQSDRGGRDELYLHLFATPLTHGFAQGHQVYAPLTVSQASRFHVGAVTLDRFYRLAEAVGAIRVKSAEHGQTTIEIGDLDAIFKDIENAIGIELDLPAQSGDLFGLRLAKGIFSERHFDGIYGAWRAREHLAAQRRHLNDFIEIGGGAGFLTYYARKMGFRRLAIVDLPQALCAQYMVLAAAFGDEEVQFNANVENGIRLLSTDHPLALNFDRADIIINVDSFPEMPRDAAFNYIGRVPPCSTLISINQESTIPNGDGSQNHVSAIAREHGLVRKARHLSWMRTGWVEELFERE